MFMSKKICFCLLLIALGWSGAFSQTSTVIPTAGRATQSIAENAKEATDWLNTKVLLSEGQYTKVLEVNKKFYEAIQAGSGGKTIMQLGPIREEKIKAILTANQWQKLKGARGQLGY